MKKRIVIIVGLIVSLTTQSVHAAEDRCAKIVEAIPTQISNIHEFISSIPQKSEVQYMEELSSLNEATNALSDEVIGCDKYTDNLAEQMRNAVAQLLIDSEKYRGIK